MVAVSPCPKCGYDSSAAVVAIFSFLVERDPPSLNTRLFNSGPRRHLYRKERDVWRMEFRVIRLRDRIPMAGPLTVAAGVAPVRNQIRVGGLKRRVTLTRVYGGRQQERDADNLAGGMKAVVDALVLEGLIANDDPGSVELHYRQERGKPTGLYVKIEVLG
jgi:Holliday junction resolvase RusA-like endonuclease